MGGGAGREAGLSCLSADGRDQEVTRFRSVVTFLLIRMKEVGRTSIYDSGWGEEERLSSAAAQM